MEIKNKMVVGLMSAMLAFTGLACATDDTADTGTDTGVEAPADGGAGGGLEGGVEGGAEGGLGGTETEPVEGATP